MDGKDLILEQIKNIEMWAGEAYYTPTTNKNICPDGDEIYQALEAIKQIIKRSN